MERAKKEERTTPRVSKTHRVASHTKLQCTQHPTITIRRRRRRSSRLRKRESKAPTKRKTQATFLSCFSPHSWWLRLRLPALPFGVGGLFGGGHDVAAGGPAGVGGRGRRRRSRREQVARVAGDAAVDALLPGVRGASGVAAERVQHVLPRLPFAFPLPGLLLLLPLPPTPIAPRHPDTAFLLPRRRAGHRGGGRPRHLRRPDLRHQQRQGPLPQRTPPATRRRRRRRQGRCLPLQLRDLRPRPPRPLPLLLPRLQAGGHQDGWARGHRAGRRGGQ